MSVILYEDPKLAKFNSKLKKARISKGYTQESLAELSGVNIKSIASYEQNPDKLNAASVSTVGKLADSLGCEIEDIINKEKEID
jgi:transcriptional regulator with XRE-family HTH domain